MTNGGFVMAKLAMALATSALTWLLTAAAVCLCLAIVGNGNPVFKGWLGHAVWAGGIPDRMRAGVAAAGYLDLEKSGGRDWRGFDRTHLDRQAVHSRGEQLFSWGWSRWLSAANIYVNFREALLHWLTGILIACLAAKIAVSIAAFVWGLRRNAITARAVGWIVGGWLVCGLFVGRLRRPCLQRDQPTRPADLGRARRIPGASAGRSGHCPAGAGLESAPLNTRLNSEG